MSSTGHNTYLPGYQTVKHHEWRTIENSAPHLLPHLQVLATKNPNLTLLDVGAGSGTITASIVKYMPSGHITAVDLSPDIVSRASAHAKEVGVASNITFQTASVYELSTTFGENVFDVVHASQMLCHLDSPVEALTQMLKVVKPGGVLALREIDMRVWSCYPDTEAMRAWHRVQLATHEAAGGSNAAGPSLVSWAMKAGAKREDIEASMGAWMYSTPEERMVWGECFDADFHLIRTKLIINAKAPHSETAS
jgi:ubiquinone/menaquinone biosynthesis C-methylase UbiE